MRKKMNCKTLGRLFLSSIFIFSACKKEEVGPQYVDEAGGGSAVKGDQVVYVLNEGNFQSGNASLTSVVPARGKTSERVFEQWTGRSLGDVAQSIERFEGAFYIVVNNSGKIEVVDGGPQKEDLGTISGLESPRYFLGLNSKKAYVTDLYADAVHIVDPSGMNRSGEIPTDGWTEAILKYEDQVYVTNMDQGRLDRIDPEQDLFVDSLRLREQPNSMVRDANGKLWVLCDGGFEEEKAALFRIDPNSFQVEKEFEFPEIGDSPSELTLSPDRNTLFFLNDGVFRMGIEEGALPSAPLIQQNGTYLGLRISEEGRIHVADAKDYVQKGAFYRYRSDGAPLDTFETGIIPTAFLSVLE